MTDVGRSGIPRAPAILTPDVQQAVWFLGVLVRIRVTGEVTGGELSVLEHECERGYGSPLHRHAAAEETFLVLEGELRVEVDGQAHTMGEGAAALLPRALPHAFVVISPQARFLTLHTPAGFERFTLEVGTPATPGQPPPSDALPPDPEALAAMARSHGIDILGPPPSP